MLVKLVRDILLGDKVFDIVGLHFRDDLERVRYEGLEFAYFKSINSWLSSTVDVDLPVMLPLSTGELGPRYTVCHA